MLRVVHSSSVIKRWDPTQTTHQQSLYLYLIMVRGCQFGLEPQWSYWLSSQARAVYLSRLLSVFVVLRKQLSFLNSTHAPSTARQHRWCWLSWHNDDPKQLTLFDGKNLPPMHLNLAPPVKSWGSEVSPSVTLSLKIFSKISHPSWSWRCL